MKIVTFVELDSTMDKARELALGGHDEFAVLADQQTGGRGRRGRVWASPPGNLYLSVVTRDVAPHLLSQYSLLWGVILQQVVAEHTASKVECKWPNDILIQGHKVAGLLIERAPGHLIVGVGINILSHPDQVMFPATNLNVHLTAPPQPRELAEQIVHNYQIKRNQWQEQGFAFIRDSWLAHAWRLKSEIIIRQETGSVVGIFETIDENGAIVLQTPCGIEKLAAGDLTEG